MGDVRFGVDTDELDALSARLSELVSAIAGIDVTVSMYDPLDLGPDRSVLQTLEDFCAEWAASIKQVGTDVADLRDRLAQASGAYQDTEGKISQASALPPGTPR